MTECEILHSNSPNFKYKMTKGQIKASAHVKIIIIKYNVCTHYFLAIGSQDLNLLHGNGSGPHHHNRIAVPTMLKPLTASNRHQGCSGNFQARLADPQLPYTWFSLFSSILPCAYLVTVRYKYCPNLQIKGCSKSLTPPKFIKLRF